MRSPSTSELTFDPYLDGYGVGNFALSESALRRAFLTLSECSMEYGFRTIEDHTTITEIGVLDPRRDEFADLCRRFADGAAELGDFERLCSGGRGIVVGSPQNPWATGPNEMNELATRFIEARAYAAGQFPETIEIAMFMGTYEQGLPLHRDRLDVAAFVLAGQKHFAVRDHEEHEARTFSIRQGQYFHWRSMHWHANSNPGREWSMTINFAVGPRENRDIPAGTPVDYVHSETKLADLMESVAFLAEKNAATKSLESP